MTGSLLKKHADELRAMWQSRALMASAGKLRAVLTVVLAKEYAAAFPVLWRATFGMQDVPRPFISGYATIAPSGRLICDVTGEDKVVRKTTIYRTTDEFVSDARRLADTLKLSDKDRDEMFVALQKWVVADQRVGPNGERLAS